MSRFMRGDMHPGCGQNEIRMLLRAASFRHAAGQGRKPDPCGLRPVP
ncbi:hypothetical protein [Pantoea sp. Marseille-Q5743]|nr:hypothetical protein [Pantoea sp. Marseille-Q5743]